MVQITRLPWATVGIAILCLAIAIGGLGENWLIYDRAHAEQPWRYVSANFAHYGGDHLVTNVAAFLLLAGTLEYKKSASGLIILIMITAPLMTLTVHHLLPEYRTFAGVSGINYAILGCLLVSDITRHRMLIVISGLGLSMYILWPAITPLSTSAESIRPVWEVHLLALFLGATWTLRPDTLSRFTVQSGVPLQINPSQQ